MRHPLITLLTAISVGGCTVGPDYQTPQTQAPAGWSGIPASAPASQPAGPTTRPAQVASWWKFLNDPALDSLLARAVASNLDLRIATARVREARALRGTVAADLWPQLDLSGGYTFRGSSANAGAKPQNPPGLANQAGAAAFESAARSIAAGNPAGAAQDAISSAATTVLNDKLGKKDSTSSRNQNLFQAGFDATWEIDVFGGIRRAVEAADADIAATVEDRNGVLITVLSEVALNYVQLRGYQRRLDIAFENIAAQQETVDITELRRVRGGFENQLVVAQAQAQLANTQSQVPLLRTAIRQAIFQISVLLGQPPASLERELIEAGSIPEVPGEVPVGLPSELLRRRPDVRSAERQLAAATARIGEATSDLFPRFSLTGSFGSQSRDMNHFLDNKSLTYSIGPAMSWPILDGWRIRSNIEVQNARQEQAVANYERIVLAAFQDVESALAAYTNEQDRYAALSEAVEASQMSRELSNELYTKGLGPFLNVLEAQRSVYSSQDAMIESETAIVTNLIALYKALGGGWEPPETQ